MEAGEFETAPIRRAVRVAWFVLPVQCIVFVALRQMPGFWALAAAQIVFLLPIVLGAVFAERAHAVGPEGVERTAWGLVSLTLVVLMLSESYYSYYQLVVSVSGPPPPSLYDVLNLLAAVMIVVVIALLSGLRQRAPADQIRVVLDLTALMAIVYIGLFHFLVLPMATGFAWYEAARWAAYSLVGVIILLGMVWLTFGADESSERSIAYMVAISLAVFAIGMLLWPVWRSSVDTGHTSSLDSLVSAIYLFAYGILAIAALSRLRDADEPWRIRPATKLSTQGVWPSTALSLVVLVGVAFMWGWLYNTGSTTPQAVVYIACGFIATFALVGRTTVTSIETALVRDAAEIDSVTGAYGGRSFMVRIDAAMAAARRHAGDEVSLVVFDLDDFSAVNSVLGHAGGDRVLADVARVVIGVSKGRASLFRLSADEFALLCTVNEDAAVLLGAETLAAIRALPGVPGQALTASVGVAGWVGRTDRADALLRRADAAQAWAKYHGKGRVVRFDERIVRALGVEERLRAHEDRSGMEMARAIGAAADARDPRNYYHSRNVAALSVMISESMGFEPEHVQRIEIAAMLHDCGKIALPEELLADVLLTSRQQFAAREHAQIGGDMAISVGMPGVAQWVRHHHERWDGAGYPDGLSGEHVPVEARIIALADAYDTMTSGTRQHIALSRGAALQEIDLGMGSRFDPAIAERFIKLVGQTASLGWSDDWSSV